MQLTGDQIEWNLCYTFYLFGMTDRNWYIEVADKNIAKLRNEVSRVL